MDLSINVTTSANDIGISEVTYQIIRISDNSLRASGALTIQSDASGSGRVTSGEIAGTLRTTSGGTVTVDMNYTATVENGLYKDMTLTGSITVTDTGALTPWLTLDFSEEGRRLHATYAQEPGSTSFNDIYPTSIFFSGRIATQTAQMDGEIEIPSTLWASNGNAYTDWQYTSNGWTPVEVCEGEFRPEKATFKGSFSELQNGTPTGVKFSGTITGNLNNAFTFDGCDMEDATNFLKWDASFDGTIEAPSRPTVTTFLKVSQSEYRKYALDVSYSRTNTDGTKVFLSGNGTLKEKTAYVERCEYWGCYTDMDDYTTLEATLKNQDGMNIAIFHDGSKSRDKKFSGSITTAGGAEMADIYTTDGVPTVKYIDYSIESIF